MDRWIGLIIARNRGYAYRACANISGNMAAKRSKALFGRNKTKSNKSTCSLPGTFAEVHVNKRTYSPVFCQTRFPHNCTLLALLSNKTYFRRFAHTMLSIRRSHKCQFSLRTGFRCTVAHNLARFPHSPIH